MLPSDEAQECAGRVFRRIMVYTLVEADGVGVDCYLETFDSRNPNFYRRLGFSAVGSHAEPVTGATPPQPDPPLSI